MVKKKKHIFYNDTIKQLSENSDRPAFWQTLKRLNQVGISDHVYKMNPKNVHDHFKKLLNNSRSQAKFPKSTETGPLDENITADEIIKAFLDTNKNASPGLDRITCRLLSILQETHMHILVQLFNHIFTQGNFPKEWSSALLVPIHKKGNIAELSNYRGIALLPALSKLFCNILNARVSKWASDTNKLSKGQLGFIKGNRTSDAHIIINNLISKYCHKEGKNMYSCFIDLEKAFDRIPRDILLLKMERMGLTGRFLNIINSMYSNDFVHIKVGDNMTKRIEVNQGVRQGCVLSPILLNLFMADLENHIAVNKDCFPVSIDNKEKVNCLLWADDIVLLSETKSGLQTQIDLLLGYCQSNLLTVNTKKTVCVCFNKGGRLIQNLFIYNNSILEDKKSIKYLGFIISANGAIKEGLEDLKIRGNKALYKLRKELGENFRKNIPLTLKLFDSFVRPVLLYMSDFWGLHSDIDPISNPIELVHLKFCKYLLGVNKNCSNLGILLEVGRDLISFQAKNSVWITG